MKVVVDTSVFLAAAFDNNADSWKILDLMANDLLNPVFNQASWEELLVMTRRTILRDQGYPVDAHPKLLPPSVREEIGFWEEMWSEIVCRRRIIVQWESPGDYVEDPDDEKIVAAGLDGNVWFVIHRDQDFNEVEPLIVAPEGHKLMFCWPDEFAAHYPDFLDVLRRTIEKRFAAS